MVTFSSYTNLLEKTRLPNPTFQRFAVVSIFQKLKSFQPHLDGGLDTDSGRNALSRCLTSTYPAVVDQSVRELCSLVATGPLSVSRGLIELQSALDACPPGFVDVFVKAIGFVCRHDFQNNRNYSISPQLHPFVKVLSCRPEVCDDELKHQVLLFIVQCVQHGITVVSDFLQPFLLFTILKSTSSVHLSLFSRDLISSIAALSCSLPNHAFSIIRLLIRCLQFYPNGNEKEFKHLLNSTHYLVDAFIVVTNKHGKTEETRGFQGRDCQLDRSRRTRSEIDGIMGDMEERRFLRRDHQLEPSIDHRGDDRRSMVSWKRWAKLGEKRKMKVSIDRLGILE